MKQISIVGLGLRGEGFLKISNFDKADLIWIAIVIVFFAFMFASWFIKIRDNNSVLGFMLLGFSLIVLLIYGIFRKSNRIVGGSMAIMFFSFPTILIVLHSQGELLVKDPRVENLEVHQMLWEKYFEKG